jgi:hypothetical protein
MNYDLPIQQTLRRTDTRFQLGFATEAKERILARDGLVLSASREGLQVLARNEEDLAGPVKRLRELYGAALEVGPPTVRLIKGVQVQEPVMHVRISLYADFRGAVKSALLKRGATLCEEYVRSTYCILRWEAPLADLLGLSEELARLSAGNAKHWVALSHYAIVTRDPGGRAA